MPPITRLSPTDVKADRPSILVRLSLKARTRSFPTDVKAVKPLRLVRA